MAVRIRSDRKTIVCAAKSRALKGDFYLDDGLHYILGVEMGVLSVCGTDKNGADLWAFHKREMSDCEFIVWLGSAEAQPYREILENDSDES